MMLIAVALLAQSLLQDGAQAMKQGRYADAVRIYREIAKQQPGDPRIRMNLGLALFSAGDYEAAEKEFAAFTKAAPQPGPAHLMLGVARLKLQRHCDAVSPLEAARKWQESEKVLLELGDAYFGCGRFAEAAAAFERLGKTPKGLQGSGLSYARLGRAVQARQAFEQLALLGETAALRELEAEVAALEGRHDDAVKSLDAAARLAPSDPRLPRLRARALWRAGQYDEALKAFNALSSRWRQDPEFLYEHGDTLLRLDSAEAALPLLKEAVRRSPALLPARGALGRALLQTGAARESIPHLEAASKKEPALLLPLSRAYKETGRAEDAARVQAEYRKKLQPQN